jgi:hypothetical protein
MKFPSWNDFKASWNKVETEIKDEVTKFKDNHEMLNKAIKVSISFLPPPFNAIAQNIYDTYLGSDEEKTEEVLKYFNELQNQGEDHYKEITLRLENVLSGIDDIKVITAKESTLLEVQKSLISRSDAIDNKLRDLDGMLRSMGVKMDELVDATAKILITADTIETQGGKTKFGTVAKQVGNSIVFMRGDKLKETITAEDLRKLDPTEQNQIKAYQQAMENNYKIWSQVYPQLPLQVDLIAKAKTEQQLDTIRNEICKDLKNILDFLDSLGKNLHDHYTTFRYICGGQS